MDKYPVDVQNLLRVGPTNLSDNTASQLRGGNFGELIVNTLGGQYAEATRRGQMFMYGVAAAAALLLPATTGNHPTVWNPAGSNTIFVPVALRMSFVSGTTTISSVILNITKNAGSTIAATAPIVTFTNVAPQNALVGSGAVSKMYFAPAVCTFVAAPAFLCATGINLGAAAPTTPGPYEMLFDGSLQIMPGNALSICASVTTTTSLWWTTLWGIEMPMAAGQ